MESSIDRVRVLHADYDNEDDQIHSGRIIKRLRSHLNGGKIEIQWEFHSDYIHRGFVLTAKCRRNDGGWEPLAMEAHEDSGSWNECFDYGESRSYMFSVKKKYHFFFGLFGDDDMEVLYDQISFAVRRGKFLKEVAEFQRDKGRVISETITTHKLEAELQRVSTNGIAGSNGAKVSNLKGSKLETRLAEEQEFSDIIEAKEAAIRAHPTWTEAQKNARIKKLREMADEIALED